MSASRPEADIARGIIRHIMRLVLDTNILVAGLASRRGASHGLLRHVLDRRLRMLAAPALWLEYESMLRRAEIRGLHGLSDAQIEDFLDALAVLMEPVNMNYLWRPQLNDPKDEMVLEIALNAGADALVTFNLRDFRAAAQRFALRLLTPADCLAMLEKQP
jgi:putative PIN family toxin of toxin-antitoxin system